MTKFIVNVSNWEDMRDGWSGVRIVEKDTIEEVREFILKDEYSMTDDEIKNDIQYWEERDSVLYVNKDIDGGGVIIIEELNNYI